MYDWLWYWLIASSVLLFIAWHTRKSDGPTYEIEGE